MDFVIRYLCFAGLTIGAAAAAPAKFWQPGWLNTLAMAAWLAAGGLLFFA